MNIPFVHASDSALVGVAGGDAAPSADARLAAHLTACQRCRSYVQDVRAMTAGSAATEAPRSSEALLSRIVAARESGALVIVAGDDAEPRARRAIPWKLVIPAAVAAALLLSTLTVERAAKPSGAASIVPAPSGGVQGDLLIWPSVASAQEPAAPREAPYPSGQVTLIARLHSEASRYVLSAANAPDSLLLHPYAILTDSVEKTAYRGRSAWRVSSRFDDGYPALGRRTVMLGGSDLRVLESRWETDRFVQTIRVTDSALIVRFAAKRGAYTDDSTHAAHRVLVSSGRIPRESNRPLVVGSAGLRLMLRTLPLREGWRGSVDLVSYESPFMVHIRPSYVNLRVMNQVMVRSGYGPLLCWRVVVDAGGQPEYWYVSRGAQELIRTERVGGRGTREAIDRLPTMR